MRILPMREYPSESEVRARHRRAVLMEIVGPVALVAVIMLVVLLGMILVLSPRQMGTVASFMSLLILVPTVLVCLVPYLLVVALFAGTRKLYLWLPSRLIVARDIIHRVDIVAHQASRSVASPIIAVSQRLAWLERVTNRD